MTIQDPETLIINGVETWIEYYYSRLPDWHACIEPVDTREFSTGCSRGYVGTWEIKDGRFYVVDLDGDLKLRDGKPLLAEWWSGVIGIPKERLFNNLPYSERDQEFRIRVANGVVMEFQIARKQLHEQDQPWLEWSKFPIIPQK